MFWETGGIKERKLLERPRRLPCLVQWSRQKLVDKGEIDGSTRGVWKLTAKGRARATGSSPTSSEELLLAHQATLKDLVYENEAEVKRRIISELQNLRPMHFELFCISFLGPLGYEQLQVTDRGADGGLTVLTRTPPRFSV